MARAADNVMYGLDCDSGVAGVSFVIGEQYFRWLRRQWHLITAQAVEHYEITRYGTLKRWAEILGNAKAAHLIDVSLQEDSQTDEILTRIAVSANETARESLAA